MNPIALALSALAVMLIVRFVLAIATREPVGRWLCVPLAWGALAAFGAMAAGCVEEGDGGQNDAAGEEPDAIGPDVDAAPAPDAAPDAPPDAPAPLPLVQASIAVGVSQEHGYASLTGFYNCPDGAPNGPHPVAFELYSNLGFVNDNEFTWTCEGGFASITWFNLSCGLTVWGRVATIDPVTGADVDVTTVTANTLPCES